MVSNDDNAFLYIAVDVGVIVVSVVDSSCFRQMAKLSAFGFIFSAENKSIFNLKLLLTHMNEMLLAADGILHDQMRCVLHS